VPQLSVKWRGQEWQGITYNDVDILKDHLTLRLNYGAARLLRSGEWTTLSENKDAWITVADNAFADGNSANGWCDANKLGPNDCFARLISTANPPPEPNHIYRN
jgi:hypothetical protein